MTRKMMEYKAEKDNYVLASGSHLGYDWVVKSLGTHPCAYVKIPPDYPSLAFEELEDALIVHGGITYTSRGGLYIDKHGFKLDGTWVGWDYAHAGDANGLYIKLKEDGFEQFEMDGKQWTTPEMIAQCRDVIEQLISIRDVVGKK